MADSMSTVDGLVSGLNTSQIISQLLALDAQPQNQLKRAVSTAQTQLSAYQSVATKMTALGTAAAGLSHVADWGLVAATSSDPSVLATAGTGATTGSVTFGVTALAQAHTVISNETFAGSTSAAPSSVSLSFADSSKNFSATSTDGTLGGLAAAINAQTSTTGVRATLVQVAAGSYRLQIGTTTTGAATAFSVSGLATPPTVLRTGQDASLDLGGGITVTSPTNTVSGLLPGLTLTVSKVTSTPVTVSLDTDTKGLADKVADLVAKANDALGTIGKLSAYDAASKTSGPLLGDPAARGIAQRLLSSVSGTVGGASLASIGLSVSRDGTIGFDRTKFTAAYTKDPTTVSSRFTTAGGGIAQQLGAIATAATDVTNGSLTAATQGRTTSIRDLNTRIADWDTRLADKRVSYQRQYSGLETALGKLKSQSNWLAGQINSLPSYSNR